MPSKSKQNLISHVRNPYSLAYRVNTPFYVTRFVNCKLVPLILFYGGCPHWYLSSIHQNQPTANLELLVIRVQVTGALSLKLVLMGTISPSDFNLWNGNGHRTIWDPHLRLFPLGTTMVFYDGHSLNLFTSTSGTSWTHSMRGRKTFNPHVSRPSEGQHPLSRMTHSLLPSTITSQTLNFSTKL